MEIMMLILLYYLSQNPDFPESVKPILCKLKNSEEMLKFLNDLSKFSEMFALFQPPQGAAPPGKGKGDGKERSEKQSEPSPPPPRSEKEHGDAAREEKEKPRSPTSGIADEFIEQCLNQYFKRR